MPPKAVSGDSSKRRQILASARQVFLQTGYERACVDVIAERASVSKATVYNHFKDKSALFLAALSAESEGMRDRLADILSAPTGCPEVDLQQAGETLLGFLVLPSSVALHRILRSEVGRFPELGRLFYESIREHRRMIARYLQRCRDAGQLVLCREDAELMTEQFVALCVSEILGQLELGVLSCASTELVRDKVQAAVWTFLRACRAG